MFLSEFVCMLIDVLLSANSRSELEMISADVHWCYLLMSVGNHHGLHAKTGSEQNVFQIKEGGNCHKCLTMRGGHHVRCSNGWNAYGERRGGSRVHGSIVLFVLSTLTQYVLY